MSFKKKKKKYICTTYKLREMIKTLTLHNNNTTPRHNGVMITPHKLNNAPIKCHA
jgi:hypothetical protein